MLDLRIPMNLNVGANQPQFNVIECTVMSILMSNHFNFNIKQPSVIKLKDCYQ